MAFVPLCCDRNMNGEFSLKMTSFLFISLHSSELQRDCNDTCKPTLCGGRHAGHPQSSLAIKHYNTRVFLPHMAAPNSHKLGFTQSYGRFYGGIVPVFIEFTAAQTRKQCSLCYIYITIIFVLQIQYDITNCNCWKLTSNLYIFIV